MKKLQITASDRLAIVKESHAAALKITSLMKSAEVPIEKLRELLQKGVLLETLTFPIPKSSSSFSLTETQRFRDVWSQSFHLGNIEVFRALLDADSLNKKPHQHEPDFFNETVASGHLDFVEELLVRGVSPHEIAKCSYWEYGSCNALAVALHCGHDDIMERLMKEGVSLFPFMTPHPIPADERFTLQPTSLIHLVKTPRAVKCLVRAGLDLSARDEGGATVLERIINMSLYHRTPEEKLLFIEAVRALVEAGAPLSTSETTCRGHKIYPWNALYTVVEKNREKDYAEILLSAGAQWPKSPFLRYITPDMACNMVEKYGIPVDWKTQGMEWLFSWASSESVSISAQHLKKMTDWGLDVDAVNPNHGMTPLIIALRNGHSDMVKALVAVGAKTDAWTGNPHDPNETWQSIIDTQGDDTDDEDFLYYNARQGYVKSHALACLLESRLEKAPSASRVRL